MPEPRSWRASTRAADAAAQLPLRMLRCGGTVIVLRCPRMRIEERGNFLMVVGRVGKLDGPVEERGRLQKGHWVTGWVMPGAAWLSGASWDAFPFCSFGKILRNNVSIGISVQRVGYLDGRAYR